MKMWDIANIELVNTSHNWILCLRSDFRRRLSWGEELLRSMVRILLKNNNCPSCSRWNAEEETVAFIDAEHALDPHYARKLGVNTDELILSQPDYGEQALQIAEELAKSGAVKMMVIDSVAALALGQKLSEIWEIHIWDFRQGWCLRAWENLLQY